MLDKLMVFFKCSYKLSGKGYQYTKVELEKNETICIESSPTMMPAQVRRVMDYGGVDIAVSKYGFEDSRYYFVIKGLENENKEIAVDEVGRNVYTNVAFFSRSKDAIAELSEYVLLNFDSFAKEISKVVIPDIDAEAGYVIDCPKVKEILGKAYCKNTVYKNSKLESYIDRIKKFKTDYVFAALPGIGLDEARDYFLRMHKLKDENAPKNVCIVKDDFFRYSKETVAEAVSGKKDDDNKTDDSKTTVVETPIEKPSAEEPSASSGDAVKDLEAKLKASKMKILELEKKLADASAKTAGIENRARTAEANAAALETRLNSLKGKMLVGGGAAALIIIVLLIKNFIN